MVNNSLTETQLSQAVEMLDKDRAQGYANAIDFAEHQLSKWAERHPQELPTTADGLIVGMMWECHRATSHDAWAATAETYGQLLEERWIQSGPSGAIPPSCLYSHLPWYLHGKDRDRRELIFRAASDLAKRFHHKGRFLGLPNHPNVLCVGVMLEVPVSFYAANETLDQDIARHATAHCRTTRDRLLNADGAACSHADFESDSANFAKAEEPCLSKSTALALLGFSQVYGLTNATEFLKVAERCAEFWLTHLPQDHVPCKTIGESGDETKDVTSAAIAACALLELAEQTRVAEHATAYRSTGLSMLDALTQPPYLNKSDGEGILARDDENETSAMLGDLHFVKGLRLGRESN